MSPTTPVMPDRPWASIPICFRWGQDLPGGAFLLEGHLGVLVQVMTKRNQPMFKFALQLHDAHLRRWKRHSRCNPVLISSYSRSKKIFFAPMAKGTPMADVPVYQAHAPRGHTPALYIMRLSMLCMPAVLTADPQGDAQVHEPEHAHPDPGSCHPPCRAWPWTCNQGNRRPRSPARWAART